MWVVGLILGCVCALPSIQPETRLRIIHTNDMHARFDQTSQLSGKCVNSEAAANRCYGGFPRLLTAVNAERKKAQQEGIPLLFLNAGDTYQGTLWYTVYKWTVVADFIKFLGIDAMSLGNHEFDDGPAGLAPFIRNITTPVLCSNLDVSSDPDMKNTPLLSSMVIDRGNLRIGVIGYLTPETSTLSQPGKVVIKDEIESLKTETNKLKADGINIIIALGHSGYDRDIEIAKAVPGLDIIVGGHSHTFLYTGVPPDNDIPRGPYPTIVTQSSGRIVPVVQAYAYTKYLGSFDIVLSDEGEVLSAVGQPILLNSSIEQDGTVLAELTNWQSGIDNVTQQTIANTRVLLNGTCRFNECNMGNLIADAFVDYGVRNLLNRSWTGVAIALYQGGGVRASIEPPDGVITREDIITSMPFYNPLVVLSVQGKYIREALEWGVARYDTNLAVGRGEFLQVSGVHVVFDLSQPVGSRVVSLKVRCSHCTVPIYLPINPEESYAFVASSFLANGGDNFTMISEHKTLIEQFDALDTDIVSEFVERQKLVYNGIEERILFVGPTIHKSAASTFFITPTLLIFCIAYQYFK